DRGLRQDRRGADPRAQRGQLPGRRRDVGDAVERHHRTAAAAARGQGDLAARVRRHGGGGGRRGRVAHGRGFHLRSPGGGGAAGAGRLRARGATGRRGGERAHLHTV